MPWRLVQRCCSSLRPPAKALRHMHGPWRPFRTPHRCPRFQSRFWVLLGTGSVNFLFLGRLQLQIHSMGHHPLRSHVFLGASFSSFSSEPRRPVAPESRHPGVPEPRLPGVPEPRLPGAPESPQGCPVLSDSLRLFYLIFCREGA